MRINEDGRVIWSASDLKSAAECEFAWLRLLDARLGRIDAVVEPDDATLQRAGALGFAHEGRQLDAYRAQHGAGVVELENVKTWDAVALADAADRTAAALRDGSAVVYQATFADDDFVGFADFLLRDADGRYVVQDTKLARRAKVTALMQLAAYADQLDRLGIPRADRVELLLGDGTTSAHAVDDILPVFRLRRERMRAMIASQRPELGAAGPIVAWGEPAVRACGRCATCAVEVVAQRDLLLVAGMRPVQRRRLADAGIGTIDALAVAAEPPDGMRADVFTRLRLQAQLQLVTDPRQDGGEPGHPLPVPEFRVLTAEALAAVPAPSPGDLFFDFEGDPLYTEPGSRHWNLDYLFGWVDTSGEYVWLWADSFAEERAALQGFLAFVAQRRQRHPDLHIYHYAPYEPTHLADMAARYGVGEAEVDTLLRDGVFIDLYPIVVRALRVGSRSYSIKKLEPLYMGDETRDDMAVTAGGDSIEEYAKARAARDEGDSSSFERIRHELLDYNKYDCVSTLRLRDWLLGLAARHDIRPALVGMEHGAEPYRPSPLALALTAQADQLAAARLAGGPPSDGPADRTSTAEPPDDETAVRVASAAIDYFRRERKSFWGTHFLRLREPIGVWETGRDVVVVDPELSSVQRPWAKEAGEKVPHRHLVLRGDVSPGTRLSVGSDIHLLYRLPAPFDADVSPQWIHVARTARVREVLDDGAVIDETPRGSEPWEALPIAIAPGTPPSAGAQEPAIEEWAAEILAAQPAFPRDAATDVLRRIPPRTRRGALPPAAPGDEVEAVVAAVLALDDSYLAVQGPPGTGKTYVGAHVIARLVRDHGFKIGVVAQSHAVVENILDRVVIDGGLDPEAVRKKPQNSGADHAFLDFPTGGVVAYTIPRGDSGYVIGGTAWLFSDPTRIPRGSLDLLVIDEAGQFSLAPTIAAARSARNLLLLGDPQQLPQVSQGIHPEPIDTSALGWVLGDRAVIPAEFGYFLAQSRRMHPDVAASVSRLSYEGRLSSHAETALRQLADVSPGLHIVAVPAEHDNTSSSPEEAERVVSLVRFLLAGDRPWTDVDLTTGELLSARALTPNDIIVVTPYNAQLVLIEEALAAAGLSDVRVGTVDRFQGQEAAVAIVSLAAASAAAAPRGIEFLLLRNRLNVAISRAKFAAYLIYSPGLLDDLPHTPEGVARLSAFARLVAADADLD